MTALLTGLAVYAALATVATLACAVLAWRHWRANAPDAAAVIDAFHIDHQREWSTATFGPGIRRGVIDHLRKEIDEVEDTDLTDLGEWVDIIILGFDGAWRADHEPQAIIDAIKAKQARNEARTWPDWRTADRDKAIEHDRSHEIDVQIRAIPAEQWQDQALMIAEPDRRRAEHMNRTLRRAEGGDEHG